MVIIVLLRIYLLAGLLLHKAVWEFMKRGQGAPAPAKARDLKTRVLSLVKVAILCAIGVQTLLPDFLPISSNPAGIRMAGLALYTLGLLIAILARTQLGKNWSDIEKSRIVDAHELVARGLYRYIRHPIYTGDLLLLAGLELALNSWAVVGVIALAFYVRGQAIAEERKLMVSLPGYERYCSETARFVPLVY